MSRVVLGPELIRVIRAQYGLPWQGIHGVSHWARVRETGLRLAEVTGANPAIVELFAVFHDARRRNEEIDPQHGRRGAEFAARLRGTLIHLPDPEFALLYQACADHTMGETKADITVQTCWDADRLDLGRVGITPDPTCLCTEAAKAIELRTWADQRSGEGHVPLIVHQEWAGSRGDQGPAEGCRG